jgi:hypothetical protein
MLSKTEPRGAVQYATVAATLIVALCPSLFFTFGFHNDFNAWGYDAARCCSGHPETRILMAIGRYFGAFAQNLQFMTIRSLGSLWAWRLIGIASIAALACFYLRIVSLRWPPEWTDVFLTIAVFTLPTMQFQAMWVSMYVFWTPPMALGLVAASLLLTVTDRDPRKDTWRAIILVSAALLALLCGLCFYPMSATIVLVPAAHLLVRRDQARFRWFAVAATFTLGTAFIVYFAVHKLLVLPHLKNVPYLGEYQFVLHPGIVGETARRAIEYLNLSSYLWMPFEVPWVPEFVLWIALAGLVFALIRLARGRLPDAIDFALACGLFLVATAPVLVVDQFSESFRITFTMTAIVMLSLFWLVRQIIARQAVPATAFAVLGILLAFAGVYGTSRSSALDFRLSQAAVAGLAPHDFHAITVVRRPQQRLAFGQELRNDFGGLAPIPLIFDALIGTRYNGAASFDVQTIYVDSASGFLERPTVLIDLSRIYGVADVADFSQFATVSATPRGAIGPLNAVDGYPATFWEVCDISLPATLEIDYPTARAVSGYDLSTVELPERMPKDWEIWTSSDQRSWAEAQKVSDAPAWRGGEKRSFGLKAAETIRGIRLVIKATRAANCMRLYEFTPH